MGQLTCNAIVFPRRKSSADMISIVCINNNAMSLNGVGSILGSYQDDNVKQRLMMENWSRMIRIIII